MLNKVVIYKTKYGTTRQYAHWIGRKIDAEVFRLSNLRPEFLMKYDVVVFGGALFASGVAGINFLKKNFNLLENKKIVIFSVGLSDNKNEENVQNINKKIKEHFTDEQMKNITIFNLRGGIDYDKLHFMDRFMMNMLHKSVLKKENKTAEEHEFLKTFGMKTDFLDKNSINPIVDLVNQFEDTVRL